MQEKFISFYCEKENIYFATSYNKLSINGFVKHAKLLPMEIFQWTTRSKSKLLPKFHNFQSNKTAENKLNKLKHQQNLIGAKLTFNMHGYFFL